MRKKIIPLLITLSFSCISFAQTYYGQIINMKNDTLNVQIKVPGSSLNVSRLIKVQDKITIIQNGSEQDYLPKDLKSFRVKLEKETVTFDNFDDIIFVQRLYVNKVKLYKYLKKISQGHIIRQYIIRKTNDSFFDVPAMGLSRLITKNDMLPAVTDCKISSDKIENDEVKIKDEDSLIEFIKDYELNCFSK